MQPLQLKYYSEDNMKKFIAIALCLSLVACATPKPPFPEAPKELMTAPEELKKIELGHDVKLSDVMSTVVENYGASHKNSTRLKAWQVWYEQEKKAYNQSINVK